MIRRACCGRCLCVLFLQQQNHFTSASGEQECGPGAKMSNAWQGLVRGALPQSWAHKSCLLTSAPVLLLMLFCVMELGTCHLPHRCGTNLFGSAGKVFGESMHVERQKCEERDQANRMNINGPNATRASSLRWSDLQAAAKRQSTVKINPHHSARQVLSRLSSLVYLQGKETFLSFDDLDAEARRVPCSGCWGQSSCPWGAAKKTPEEMFYSWGNCWDFTSTPWFCHWGWNALRMHRNLWEHLQQAHLVRMGLLLSTHMSGYYYYYYYYY